jgi:L-ribulose-5-phosphate 3-epimerase UlaE
MADADDEQHQEMLDWLCLASADSFDPKAFSIDEVNARLARLAASPVSITVVR